MKDKVNVALLCCIVVFSVISMIIMFMAIGKSEVASYENYVVGGFGGFLIVENLIIPFWGSLAIIAASTVTLLYRMVKYKKK